MSRRSAAGWLLVLTLGASGCRGGVSDVAFGEIERLNGEAGALASFSFPYYTALKTIADGGAIAVWMRREDQFRPLVYRRADGAGAPFGGEEYLSPETLRETISIVPTVVDGERPGELYAAWQARRPTSGDKFVVFRRSADGGATWEAARTLNSEPTSFIPAITTGPGGAIFTAWTDERVRRTEVFFNRSLDSGETWLGSDVRVSGETRRRAAAISVSIATDGADRVVVVWEEQGSGGRIVRAVSSSDRGGTWGDPVRVDDGRGRGAPGAPQVVFVDGRALVVWTTGMTGTRPVGQVWSDLSTDGGSTWGVDTLLHEVEGGVLPKAHLLKGASEAHLVFHAGLADDSWYIYHAATGAGGKWQESGTAARRVNGGEGKFANPRLAVDGDGATYVTYVDAKRRVYLNRSVDSGQTWATDALVYEVRADQGRAEVRYPQVAAAGGTAYVMWELWADSTGMFRTFADVQHKQRPADLYVRRVTFRR